MRNAFSHSLVQAARANPKVLLLTGDHGYSLFDEFRCCCPSQYYNAGVAEQNMVGVAAGLAKGGFLPVAYGLSAFVPIRVLEQIKLDICYQELHVVLIGDGAGVVYSALGSSHQSTEDIAALRALPHLSILSPADDLEMSECMALALQAHGPVYVRMGKADLGRVHANPPELRWGELSCVRHGNGKLCWIATGSMVQTALAAATRWPGSAVWSAPCIKPLRASAIAELCQRHTVVVTLEEHSVHGGLGSAVTEISTALAPAWVCRIGIPDRFSQYCGSYAYLMREHHLDVASVQEQVEQFLGERAKQRAAA
jgi:transketolase